MENVREWTVWDLENEIRRLERDIREARDWAELLPTLEKRLAERERQVERLKEETGYNGPQPPRMAEPVLSEA